MFDNNNNCILIKKKKESTIYNQQLQCIYTYSVNNLKLIIRVKFEAN